jgi:N-ethylmaleimide reductase
MDHSGTGQPGTSPKAKELIRKNFKGTLILNNGFDAERAEAELEKGNADLIAFGRPFISNPDLPRKMQEGIPLLASDHNTFFTPGEKGYTDY